VKDCTSIHKILQRVYSCINNDVLVISSLESNCGWRDDALMLIEDQKFVSPAYLYLSCHIQENSVLSSSKSLIDHLSCF